MPASVKPPKGYWANRFGVSSTVAEVALMCHASANRIPVANDRFRNAHGSLGQLFLVPLKFRQFEPPLALSSPFQLRARQHNALNPEFLCALDPVIQLLDRRFHMTAREQQAQLSVLPVTFTAVSPVA